MRTGLWWENPEERDHLKDPDIHGSIIIKWILKKWDGKAWNRLTWLTTETGGGLL